MRTRKVLAALALAAALPALAYVLPVPGILRRIGDRRAALQVDALSVPVNAFDDTVLCANSEPFLKNAALHFTESFFRRARSCGIASFG